MKKTTKLLATLGVLASLVAGCGSNTNNVSKDHNNEQQETSLEYKYDTNGEISKLAQKEYKSGTSVVKEINSGKSTLNISDWKENKVEYSNLDSLNRQSGGAIAYLDKNNLTKSENRTRQTVEPTGWHQKKNVNGQPIINRGHLLAYTVTKGIDPTTGMYKSNVTTGDENNMKNLFTQTAYSNQQIQTHYEEEVRDALAGGNKVIYQVQPIFVGDELMARGVHLQAVGTNNSVNFNVYIYNVEPNVKFNYSDGTSKIDRTMKVRKPVMWN